MNRALTVLATLTLTAGLAFAQAEKPKPSTQPASPTQAPKPTVAPVKVAKPSAPPAQAPSEASMAAMMEACMKAGTPGKMHEYLAKGAGTWEGTMKHWMQPGTPAMESKCTSTITSVMGGRFSRCESEADMQGMPFQGFGIYGYDNVSEKFQMTWIDNMSTCVMTGTGVLSDDGKTLTWTMNYSDPMTKKPAVMREVDRRIDDTHTSLEMYGPDLTGKEFKMMEINFTRKAGSAAPAPTK